MRRAICERYLVEPEDSATLVTYQKAIAAPDIHTLLLYIHIPTHIYIWVNFAPDFCKQILISPLPSFRFQEYCLLRVRF